MLSAVKRRIIGYSKENYWVFKGELLGMKGEKMGMPFYPQNLVGSQYCGTQRKEHNDPEEVKKEKNWV